MAKESQKRNVKVYMFVFDTTASAYYRIIQPFKFFKSRVKNGFEFHLTATLHPQYFADGDIFIFQRFADRGFFDLLMFLRNQGKKVIFDMDYYPEPPPYHPSFGFFSSLRPFLQLVLSGADYILAPTQKLALELKSYNEKISVIPNYLYPGFWKNGKREEKKRDLGLSQEAVVLGWIGHPANYHSLKQVKSVLEELSSKFENLYFAFFGEDPQFIALPPERKIIREFKAYPSYLEYLDFIDVGIAPLEECLFNQCKSPSLALEYGMKKIPVVASPITPYEDLKGEGAPIFLAKEREEWVKALSKLIEDEAYRKERGEALYDFVNKNYLLERGAQKFLQVFEEVLGRSAGE